MDTERRWMLPDQESALAWAAERRTRRIRCILALAGEYAEDPGEARSGADSSIACIHGIASAQALAGTSVSVKPSTLGSLFDEAACREHAIRIAREAGALRVPLELDMEGRGFVDLTISLASSCRKEQASVTVALQAYLRRTPGDIRRMAAEEIGVRLVKGAYLGDISDFAEIREVTVQDAGILKDLRTSFSIGTHDPELIGRIKDEFGADQDLVEFGFLMGLSEQTKTGLAKEGWRVSEYVPFGPGGDAYIRRRERYLGDLARAGRAPAP
jgi:proline dehydrogenase